MTTDEILELLAEGLEVTPGTLTRDTRIDDVEEWNSIGWLSIMSLLDERADMRIEAKEIPKMLTVGDVVDYIVRKSA